MEVTSRAALGRGAIWSVVNNGLTQFLGLAVFLVTARFVSKEAFGIMAVCFLIVESYKLIAIESLGTAITAQAHPADADYNACFAMILGIGVFGATAMGLGAPLIEAAIGIPDLAPAVRLTSVLVLTAGLARTHEAWLSRHMRFRELALRALVSIVVGGGLGITMAVMGYGLASLIAQQLVTGVVGLAVLWGATGWRPTFATDRASMLKLFRVARQISLTGIANAVNVQSDTFFSSLYLGAAATGVYNAAKRIIVALNAVVANALGRVALPAFANVQNDPARFRNGFLDAVGFTTILTAPLYAGMAALAPDLIAVLLGPKWLDVAPILAILTGAAYLTSLGQFNQSVYVVCGRARWQTMLVSLYAVINVGLFVIFARFGLGALAAAFTLRAVCLYPLSAWGALHLLKVRARDYVARLLPSLAAAALMGAAVYAAKTHLDLAPILRLVVLVPSGAALYAALILLFDRPHALDLLRLARHVAGR